MKYLNWFTAAIALLSLATTVTIFYFQSISELEVIQQDNITIFEVPSEVPELTILYDSISIENLHQSTFKIFNNSNRELGIEDFVKPIEIRFGDSCRIINYQVIESFPNYITSNIALSDNNDKLFIDFNLLIQTITW